MEWRVVELKIEDIQIGSEKLRLMIRSVFQLSLKPAFPKFPSTCYQEYYTYGKMSFEGLSERLISLQDANTQLRELIDRLTTIKFQPGSIPLDTEDGGVISELTAEIQETIKAQEEDFEILLEEVEDVGTGRYQSPAEQRKEEMENHVKKAMKELKLYVSSPTSRNLPFLIS